MSRPHSSGEAAASPPSRFAYWALIAFAVVVALFGALKAAGGLWLIILGGSWYYLPAGSALLVAGVLMAMSRLTGVMLFWLTFIVTVIWALWEVGLTPWALMPRVLALAVMAVISLCFIPVIRRHHPSGGRP